METIDDIVREMRAMKSGQHVNGGRLYERFMMKCQIAEEYADRVLAAHKRDIVAYELELDRWFHQGHKDRAKMKSLRTKNEKLRKLVKDMADELDMVKPKICAGCPASLCSIAGEPCEVVKYTNALVARAREEV